MTHVVTFLRTSMISEQSSTPATEALWPLATVLAMTGLSRSSMYSLMKAGSFPVPRKVSARSVRWRAVEVLAWIRSK